MPVFKIHPAIGIARLGNSAAAGGVFFPGIECGWFVRAVRLDAQPFE
jgi:hypothetical protein